MLALIGAHQGKSTCAVIAGAVGSMTLTGVLSAIASGVAIFVGVLQALILIKSLRQKKGQ